jgi:hypothetical protein
MEMEKPSKAEDEYFARQEIERKKKWAQERQSEMADEEKKRRRELHHMKCPKCGMDLQEFELHGVKLDRCVSCGGTWFDSGEVEQMLEKSDTGLFKRVMSVFR